MREALVEWLYPTNTYLKTNYRWRSLSKNQGKREKTIRSTTHNSDHKVNDLTLADDIFKIKMTLLKPSDS